MKLQTLETYDKPENDTSSNQRRLLTGFLVGPVVYTLYFFAVYLAVEAVCKQNSLVDSVLGLNIIEFTVLGLTIAAVMIILAITPYAYQDTKNIETGDAQDNRTFIKKVGFWLSGFFIVVTLVTGVPILFLEPCRWV